MNEILTKELVEKFLCGERWADTAVTRNVFTSIEDTAAKALSKYKGGSLFLKLIKLSDKTAESLCKYKGDFYLGVSELSDTAAEVLSKHKGGLDLNVDELSDAAAESLSKHKGGKNYDGDLRLPPILGPQA